MLINILLLLLGFVLLVVGAGKFIEGSAGIARRFNLPEIVIGLTIVSLGTSAPELVVNVVAAAKGESAMVLGNVMGSNIFNVLMILGITSFLAKLTVKRNTTWLEIPLSLMGAVLVLVVVSDKILDKESINVISRTDGIVLLCLAIIFLVYNLELAKKENEFRQEVIKEKPVYVAILWLLAGMAGLIIGGRLIVENAVSISRVVGISERVIAITVVSVGTSLPELVTSIMAVRKNKVDMAIGNVVGSCIINIFFVLGISSIVNPIQVADNSFLDIGVNLLAGILLFTFLLFSRGRQLKNWNGIVFLLIYLGYLLILLFPVKL